MDFRVLGSIEVAEQGRPITPQRAKQRALLAMLLLHANQVVSTDALVDALWGEAPPETAGKALHGHVSALRKLLGSKRIDTVPGGYRLNVERDELDLDRFESLVALARRIADPAERAVRLAEALGLWRDEMLVDVRDEGFAQMHVARLDELRLAVDEERLEAELEAGHHARALPELAQLAAREPLRERVRGLLMLALYRSGRQADALHVYQEGRRLLSHELGIDPGSALQALERQILAQDPALDPPLPAPAAGPRQERKRVTVLVVELISSGPLDPEELGDLIGPARRRVHAVLERFGGTVQALFSNALLGIFGAPRAHEDDPERAVRAALAALAEIPDGGFEARMGVETGEALVTIAGDRLEVTGAVLTEAARLQAAAPADAIVVGEAAFRATHHAIGYVEHGPATWRATAPKAPVHAVGEPFVSPFIGRDAELALLERAFARACSEERVQLVTIAGEPGAGKTRLVSELRALLERSAEQPTWREGRCLPYGDGVTFWALGEVVKAESGLLESDGPEDSARKLAASIAALVPDEESRAWLRRSLAPLLGVDGGAGGGEHARSFAAWRQFLDRIAWRRPLVVVFEDLHWADPALLQFVGYLAEQATGPLLIVCTARLELFDAHPEWGAGKRNATTITLSPLSAGDTRRLLGMLLGRDALAEEVRRTGGNPLFAQELARIAGANPEAVPTVPDSIQALIAARLDTLDSGLKDLTASAAVVGEVFWSGALAAIQDMDEGEVVAGLDRLVSSEVIRRARASSVRGTNEYAFLHVLVRDVAYVQIPRAARGRRHVAAARWIERLAGRVVDHAELVAHHYGAALELARLSGDSTEVPELEAKARQFFMIAADRAMGLDVGAAERLYRRALDLAPPDHPERSLVLARLADAAQEAFRLHEAVALYDEAIAAFTAQGAALDAGRAMTSASMALWRLGDTVGHRAMVDAAVALLEREPAGPDLVRAWAAKARDLEEAGHPSDALPWIERAMRLAAEFELENVTARLLQFRGWARLDLGDPAGIGDVRESIELASRLGLGFETAVGYSNLAELVALEEGPAAGIRVCHECIALSEQRGLLHNAVLTRAHESLQQFEDGGWDEALAAAETAMEGDRTEGPTLVTVEALIAKARVLAGRGAIAEAESAIHDLLPLARRINILKALVPALAAAAEVRWMGGEISGALTFVTEIEATTRDNPGWRGHAAAESARVCAAGDALSLAEALLEGADTTVRRRHASVVTARAEIAESRGDLEGATSSYREAIDLWAAFGHAPEHARSLLGHGRCLVRLDRLQEALRPLVVARDILDRLGARPFVDQADDWLARAGARHRG